MTLNRFRIGIAAAAIGASTLASSLPGVSYADNAGTATEQGASDIETTECVAVEPFNVVEYPDGGRSFQYMIGGALTAAPVPPTGFRPEDASPETLARYGFPARPENADDAAAWESDMLSYKSTPLPELCETSEIGADLFADGPDDGITPRPISGVVNRTSGNWAGWEARPASGNRFVAVSGEYNVAARQGDPCTDSRVSNWVGIGGGQLRGDGSAGLLQTGTAFGVTGAPYAWWEYVGRNDSGGSIGVAEQRINSLNISAGDHIHTSVFYQTSNDQANFIVQNETTGQSQSIVRTIDGRFYQGSTTEFITERPTVGGSLAPLQAFTQYNWTAAKVQTQGGDWVYLGDTHDQVRDRMTRRAGGDVHTLAAPDGIGGTLNGAFSTDWNRCN